MKGAPKQFDSRPGQVAPPFGLANLLDSRRLHHLTALPRGDCDLGRVRFPAIAPLKYLNRVVQQPNCVFDGCRAQVHIPLRRCEILVARQLLNGPGWWCPTHSQMQAEGVSQDMHARFDVRPSRRASRQGNFIGTAFAAPPTV
jgi:hypothetical protein